jgi:hypothetical protein
MFLMHLGISSMKSRRRLEPLIEIGDTSAFVRSINSLLNSGDAV